MGALDDLRAVKNYLIGGRVPPLAAASGGDISQMIKYLIANPSAPTWDRLYGDATGDVPLGASQPFAYWAASSVAGGVTRGFGVAPAITVLTTAWDATLKMYVLQSTAVASAQSISIAMPGRVQPYGAAGVTPPFTNSKSYPIPVATAAKIFCLEFYGKLLNDTAAPGSQHGYGIGTSVGGGANHIIGSRNAGFFGGKVSRASAGSGFTAGSIVADNNIHLHRIEYEDIAGTYTARFYVDNVLGLTLNGATVPIPATVSTMGTISAYRDAGAVATANLVEAYGFLAYWK